MLEQKNSKTPPVGQSETKPLEPTPIDRPPTGQGTSADQLNQQILVWLKDRDTLHKALADIPHIGQAIGKFVTDGVCELVEGRLERTLGMLQQHATGLDASRLDTDYLNSDAFLDLFMQTMDRAVRTRSPDKLDLYVRILVRSLDKRVAKERDKAEEYLNIVTGLSEMQLRVAAAFYAVEQARHPQSWDDVHEPLAEILPGVPPELLRSYLLQLENVGLVRDVGRSPIAGGEGSIFMVTPYFHIMMSYLGHHLISPEHKPDTGEGEAELADTTPPAGVDAKPSK